ncbi:MAG: fasciclin domain-containing protein [Xanthomonadales bacterium]|nr:fasciclin domain-containing protein [Xanthomonadales bacterium]
MKPHLTLPIAIASALAIAACAKRDTPPPAAEPAAVETPAETMPAEPMPTATENPTVGGAAMDATKDIVTNASAAPNLSTLVAAVKAADLVATLQGAGPFTVFAPTDDAFAKLPAGTVDGLLKPEKKADLAGLLTYHVVAGNVDAAALAQQIEAGGGSATLTTVQGATLTAKSDGMGGITLTDGKGGTAKVTTADVRQSNGVVHVIDSVLMPM